MPDWERGSCGEPPLSDDAASASAIERRVLLAASFSRLAGNGEVKVSVGLGKVKPFERPSFHALPTDSSRGRRAPA